MPRGETLGQRRRRRRRERHGGDPAFDPDPPVTSPRRLAEAERAAEARALDGLPAWVRAAWETPRARLALSALFLALGAWIVASAVLDVGFLERRRAVWGFICAPALLGMFGLTAYEAARDLARGTNTRPTVFRLDRLLLGTRAGRAAMVVYLALAIAAVAVLL